MGQKRPLGVYSKRGESPQGIRQDHRGMYTLCPCVCGAPAVDIVNNLVLLLADFAPHSSSNKVVISAYSLVLSECCLVYMSLFVFLFMSALGKVVFGHVCPHLTMYACACKRTYQVFLLMTMTKMPSVDSNVSRERSNFKTFPSFSR